MKNPTKELALKFGRYISKNGLLGDYSPCLPKPGEEPTYGFSEVKIDEDGGVEAINFKPVEEIYEEFDRSNG